MVCKEANAVWADAADEHHPNARCAARIGGGERCGERFGEVCGDRRVDPTLKLCGRITVQVTLV
jgi:hypothetical protein